jgi:hypothetical protein
MTTWIFGLSLLVIVALATARRRREQEVILLPPETISTLLATLSRNRAPQVNAALRAASAILK